MARDRSTKCKQCRREGMKLFLKGERCLTEKCAIERRSYPPGEHGRGRIKQSEYLLQLREKQKARRYYGLLEKQFQIYYEKATRGSGVTGENLLRLLESRFDNVLVRLGFAGSRRQARQMILHGTPSASACTTVRWSSAARLYSDAQTRKYPAPRCSCNRYQSSVSFIAAIVPAELRRQIRQPKAVSRRGQDRKRAC